MSIPNRTTGRCLCGALKFEATGKPLWVVHCHCQSCRRNTGAPVTTYVGFPKENFRYLEGEAKVYESSPGVRRRFCGNCGNPLSYEADHSEGEIHLFLSTLDNPEDFKAERHIFTEEGVPWFHIDDDLPRHPRTSRG